MGFDRRLILIMKNLWNDTEARKFINDPLGLRVYTSRLLGADSDLVLHGGGNTSVKVTVKNFFGEREDILYVKGSGWDLATIEKEGFAPVKMDVLLKMAGLKALNDTQMVHLQRAAMTNPNRPNPSVEAILHAIIPFNYVDHTHADAVVTMTNTKNGLKRIKALYGKKVLIVPYIMPGFLLAQKVYQMTRAIDWSQVEAMILMHHGVFTFHDDAKKSYETMIAIVEKAHRYLDHKAKFKIPKLTSPPKNLLALAQLRKAISSVRGKAVLARLAENPAELAFAMFKNVSTFAQRGPLTPDHVIRTKRIPLIFDSSSLENDVKRYARRYKQYFNQYKTRGLQCLDEAPRWAVWKSKGCVIFGQNEKELTIISDIMNHTIKSILWAQKLGGWKALPAKDIFDVEYWELEQAKLSKNGVSLPFQGKVALVTGAASGIGRACCLKLLGQGASVMALDKNEAVSRCFKAPSIFPLKCDVTDARQMARCIDEGVARFGGLDVVISNAGSFPAGEHIAHMNNHVWDQSIKVNLSSHQLLLQKCIPYLSHGIDPAVIILASKNVPAPGPGASAYSVAKAGLTQLARIAALELADKGIRVNVIHPNQVFDTGLWTDEILSSRARQYGQSVRQYKKNNLLKVTISSSDVAELACTMAGPVFSKTTGAQVSIDGGNERVI